MRFGEFAFTPTLTLIFWYESRIDLYLGGTEFSAPEVTLTSGLHIMSLQMTQSSLTRMCKCTWDPKKKKSNFPVNFSDVIDMMTVHICMH